jgi:hypothetical protein
VEGGQGLLDGRGAGSFLSEHASWLLLGVYFLLVPSPPDDGIVLTGVLGDGS